MKQRKYAGLLAVCLLLTGCAKSPEVTLSDVWCMHGVQRLYLQENGAATPFWLLEERDGACLLLREHVITEVAFAHADSTDSWYAGSALDEYLNGSYESTLGSAVRAHILPADVVIYSRDSISRSGTQMQTIVRNVFVLSWTEVTGRKGVQEGTFIPALKEAKLLTAHTQDGHEATWWLRTPDTWYWHTVLGVNEEGGICRLTTQDDVGVHTGGARPALYLDGDVRVVPGGDGWQLAPSP